MEAIQEIKAHKLNFLKTCFIYSMFLVIGLGIAIPGPTLLDLQIAVNCSLQEIGYLLPGRALGYATGSILGGFVPQNADKQPFIIACFTLASLFLGFLPWNRTLVALIVTAIFKGLFMGMTEVCGNVFVLELWGKKSAPFIQVLYFFFGLGAFIAPLITEPFLLPLISEENEGNSSLSYTADDVKIHYPYFFVASYAIVVSFIFTVIYCIRKENQIHSSIEEKSGADNQAKTIHILIAVVLGTLFLHFYFGNEICFGSFLTSFAVKSDLKFDKSSAAFMTAVFWGTYTFFRLVVIVFTDMFGLGRALLLEIVLMLTGNILFIFGTCYTINVTVVWIATVLMGLGFSACYALTVGYLQQFFPISSKMISAFLIAACVGEFVYPLITAQYIEQFPNIFVVNVSCCTLSATILMVVLTLVCRHFF